MITFDRKWFNPLYFILLEILKDPNVRTVLIYGGKSSAKTFTVCQLLAKESLINGANAMAFRKESTTVPHTLKKSFEGALDKMYIAPAFENQDRRFVCRNKSEIILKGMDDEGKAKGVESFKYVLLDELDQYLEGEYDAIEMSVRGQVGQKIFALWNPVNENSWVKTNLVDKQQWIDMPQFKLPCDNSSVKKSADGLFVLIKTTYEDNYWISGSPEGDYGFVDHSLIAKYKAMKDKNYNRYRVEVLGEWGKISYGGEIIKKWKSEKHITQIKYNPDLPLHLSFDENVNPYFPCGFFQIEDDMENFQLIDLLAMKNPDNTVKSMCREIVRKLQVWDYDKKDPIFIYGDATSDKEDVKQEKGHDLFKLITIELTAAGYICRRKVEKSNPSVKDSMNFFNSILDEDIDKLRFQVNEKCRVAIMDYENAKEDKNGKIDKKTVTDPVTKVAYQPYGHFIDLTRYFICTAFSEDYKKFRVGTKGGKIRTGKNESNYSY